MTFGIFTTCQRRPYTICMLHPRVLCPESSTLEPNQPATQPTVVVHGNCVVGCSMMSCLFVKRAQVKVGEGAGGGRRACSV